KHIDCASHHLQHELARSLSSARVTRYGTDDFFPVQCRPMFTLRASLISLYRRKRIDPALFSFLRTARTVRIPPLRARAEDIPLLAEDYIRRDGTGAGIRMKTLARELRNPRLWPRNVCDLFAYVRTLLMQPDGEMFCQFEQQ